MTVVARDDEALARFGARLQQVRLGAKLSRADIARAVGVTRQAVTMWERGRRTPEPMAVVTMEGYLGQRPGSLLRLAYPDEGAGPRMSAEQAINEDDGLTANQRAALLAVLAGFRELNEALAASEAPQPPRPRS